MPKIDRLTRKRCVSSPCSWCSQSSHWLLPKVSDLQLPHCLPPLVIDCPAQDSPAPPGDGTETGSCGCSAGTDRRAGPDAMVPHDTDSLPRALTHLCPQEAPAQSAGAPPEAPAASGGPRCEKGCARVLIDGGDSLLLPIPAGEFTMGTDTPGVPMDGESPARRVSRALCNAETDSWCNRCTWMLSRSKKPK